MKNILTAAAFLFSLQAFCQGQFQKEASGSITFTSGQIMQLAHAIPAEKYSWSPGKGVRSVAEVASHIVSSNYFFASKLGAKIPEGVNMQTVEKDLKTKDAIEAELKRSFTILIGAINTTKDASLTTKVEFPFPGDYTIMSTILIAHGHANEHLGQLIAYARMNGITPPWSQPKDK